MSRAKGSAKTGGRKRGTPNKTTALLKDALIKAAVKAGEKLDENTEDGIVTYLTEQASANPGPFMALLGKVLPMQVANADDSPFVVQIVRYGDDTDTE
jgi:hypothetical protein